MNLYENDQVLAEYLLFHYGTADDMLPTVKNGPKYPVAMRKAIGFPQRTAAYFSDTPVERGLDLGCAVGRSTFEMARNCRKVIGIDFSKSFITAAEKIAQGEEVMYPRREEGSRATPLVATLPWGVDASRVSFEVGDALELRPDLGQFDRVHAANLLCRLSRPEEFLRRLGELVVPGGELVLATPFTWLEDFTPSARWPRPTTSEWMLDTLGKDFTLDAQIHEPFLIRETARKFQWSFSWLTRWKRN